MISGSSSWSTVEAWKQDTPQTREYYQNALIKEMKNAFKRSQEFPDLEMKTDEQLEMQQETETRNAEYSTTSESENMQRQTIQIVTRPDQVEEMISKGWRLVATISENKVVVEKNGGGKRSV